MVFLICDVVDHSFYDLMYNRISIIYKDSISDSYFAESFSERGVALVNKCGENTFFQKGFSPHISYKTNYLSAACVVIIKIRIFFLCFLCRFRLKKRENIEH